MSIGINDGGAAFPVPTSDFTGSMAAEGGMSLRDWFAGQALAGMNACMADAAFWPSGITLEDMVASTYNQADAMLVRRKSKP